LGQASCTLSRASAPAAPELGGRGRQRNRRAAPHNAAAQPHPSQQALAAKTAMTTPRIPSPPLSACRVDRRLRRPIRPASPRKTSDTHAMSAARGQGWTGPKGERMAQERRPWRLRDSRNDLDVVAARTIVGAHPPRAWPRPPAPGTAILRGHLSDPAPYHAVS
jgi:hypothetical protein